MVNRPQSIEQHIDHNSPQTIEQQRLQPILYDRTQSIEHNSPQTIEQQRLQPI